MLSFALVFLVVQTRSPRPDAIIGSTVHPFAAFAAWVASRVRRATFLYEIRDLWPQTLVDMGALTVGSPGERLLRWIESFLVLRSSVVITLLPGVKQYLIEQGLPADHVLYVPNGVDLEAFDRAAARALDPSAGGGTAACLSLIRAIHDEGRLVFAYVGAFGRVNQLSTIVDAARIAETRSPGTIGVLLIGDGPERDAIQAAIVRLESVRLSPPVAKSDVPAILAAIDVGIVHATATPTYRYGISFNKLFEYLAARRPVVFACISGNDPVATAHAGISVPPVDPERMADAFLELAACGPSERARMGEAGRAYVADGHDIERLAAILAGPDGLGRVAVSGRESRTTR
jgi:glycosyltransferase involved in cell wall biosynthesis